MKRILFFLISLIILGIACQNKKEKNLAEIEKVELAKNERHDSLFLDIHLGMVKDSFYNYCWAMNKKGLFNEGDNKAVVYNFKEGISENVIQMDFFPQFSNDRITEVYASFKYRDLDFFNKENNAQALVEEVRTYFEKTYGHKFFVTTLPTNEKALALVNGNREVIMTANADDRKVNVVFKDLSK